MRGRRSTLSMLCATLGVAVSACGGATAGSSDPAASSVKLQGAGASFPAPLYTKWFKAYSAAHQNVLVDYQSVGSGGGVKSVIDHTVDLLDKLISLASNPFMRPLRKQAYFRRTPSRSVCR